MQIILGKVRSFTSPGRGPSTGSDHCSLQTGAELLTDKQCERLRDLFGADQHIQVQATWGIYQRMIAAYRHPDRNAGKQLMTKLIDAVSTNVPAALIELITLGRTLKTRADDVLAYFDRPGTSNGPTEAICECRSGWSGTGWSGWFWSRCPACDSRSNWPVSAVSFR